MSDDWLRERARDPRLLRRTGERIDRASAMDGVEPNPGPRPHAALGPHVAWVTLAVAVLGIGFLSATKTWLGADAIAPVLEGSVADPYRVFAARGGALDPMDRSIWLGHAGGGLTRVDPGTFAIERVRAASGRIPSDDVEALDFTDRGQLALVTGDARRSLVVRNPAGQWTRPIEGGRVEGLDPAKFRGAAAYDTFLVVLLQDGRLVKYDRRRRELAALEVDGLPGEATSIAVDRAGGVLVAAGGRLFALRLAGAQWTVDAIQTPPGCVVVDVLTSGDGLLVRTSLGAVWRMDVAAGTYAGLLAGETFPELDLSKVRWAWTSPDGTAVWIVQTTGHVGRYDTGSGAWGTAVVKAGPSLQARPLVWEGGRSILVPASDGSVYKFTPTDRGLSVASVLPAHAASFALETDGTSILALGTVDGGRALTRWTWSGSGSAAVFEKVLRVQNDRPALAGPIVDAIGSGDGASKAAVFFATESGKLFPYDTNLRALSGEPWELAPGASWVAVRSNGVLVAGVTTEGKVHVGPHWSSPAVDDARIPMRALSSSEHFGEAADPGFFSDGTTLFALENLGDLESYSLDVGAHDVGFRVRDRQVRRTLDGILAVIDADGVPRSLVADLWKPAAGWAPGAEADRFGHGERSIPVHRTDQGWDVLELARSETPSARPLFAAPPAPSDAPVLPIHDVAEVAGGAALAIADGGGLRTYSAGTRRWHRLDVAGGVEPVADRGWWRFLPGDGALWAIHSGGLLLELAASGGPEVLLRVTRQWSDVVAAHARGKLLVFVDATGRVRRTSPGAAEGLLLSGRTLAEDLNVPFWRSGAVVGDSVFLLEGGRSGRLFRYDTASAELTEASAVWSLPIQTLVPGRRQALAIDSEGRVFAGTGAMWSAVAHVEEGVRWAYEIEGGLCVAYKDGRVAAVGESGARILVGASRSDADLGPVQAVAVVSKGLLLAGSRGIALWAEGPRSIAAFWPLDGGVDRFVSLGASVVAVGPSGCHVVDPSGSTAPRPLDKYVDVAAASVGGDEMSLGLSRDGTIHSLSRTFKLPEGALTGDGDPELRGPVRRVVVHRGAYFLETAEPRVLRYDPTSRRIDELWSERGGAPGGIQDLAASGDVAYLLDGAGTLKVWGDAGQAPSSTDGVTSAAFVVGGVLAVGSGGSVRKFSPTDGVSPVVEPLRRARIVPIDRWVPMGESTAIRAGDGVFVYDPAAHRGLRAGTLAADGDIWSIGKSGAAFLDDRRYLVFLRPGLSGVDRSSGELGKDVQVRGASESIAVWTPETVEIHADTKRTTVFQRVEPQGAATPLDADARFLSAPNGPLWILDRTGRLWQYRWQSATWTNVARGVDAPRLLAGGESAVAWTDPTQAVRLSSGNVVLEPTLRIPNQQSLAWAVDVGESTLLRLSETSLRWEPTTAEIQSVGPRMAPPLLAPQLEVRAPNAVWLQFPGAVWGVTSTSSIQAEIEAGHELVGRFGDAPIVMGADRDPVVVGAKREPLRTVAGASVPPPGAKVERVGEGLFCVSTAGIHARVASEKATTWTVWTAGAGTTFTAAEVDPDGIVAHARRTGAGDDETGLRLVRLVPGRTQAAAAVEIAETEIRWVGPQAARIDRNRWLACLDRGTLADSDRGLVATRPVDGVVSVLGAAGFDWKDLPTVDDVRVCPHGRLQVHRRGEASGRFHDLAAELFGEAAVGEACEGSEATHSIPKGCGWIVGVVDPAGFLRRIATAPVSAMSWRSEGFALEVGASRVRLESDGTPRVDAPAPGALPSESRMLVLDRTHEMIEACGSVEGEPFVRTRVGVFRLEGGEWVVEPRVRGQNDLRSFTPSVRARTGVGRVTLERDRGEPIVLDLARGVRTDEWVERLWWRGPTLLGQFAAGAIRRLHGPEATRVPATSDELVPLRGDYAEQGGELRFAVGDRAVAWPSRSDGRGFAADDVVDVLPDGSSAIVLTRSGLWRCSDMTRRPILADGSPTQGDRLGLLPEAGGSVRPCVVRGQRVWSIDGLEAAAVDGPVASVSKHASVGTLKRDGLVIRRPIEGAVEVRFGDGRGLDVPVDFLVGETGCALAHDVPTRVVVHPEGAFLQFEMVDAETRWLGGERSWGPEFGALRPFKTPAAPSRVSIPTTSIEFVRTEGGYVCSVGRGESRVTSSIVGGRFSHDVATAIVGRKGGFCYGAPSGVYVVEDLRNLAAVYALPLPPVEGERSFELAYAADDTLFARQGSAVFQWIKAGSWERASDGPFAPSVRRVAGPRVAGAPWEFGGSDGDRLVVRRRFGPVARNTAYDAARGNLTFALPAIDVPEWTLLVADGADGSVRIATADGLYAMRKVAGDCLPLADGVPPPSGPPAESPIGSSSFVLLREQGRVRLGLRPADVTAPTTLPEGCAEGQMPWDLVRDVVVSATDDGWSALTDRGLRSTPGRSAGPTHFTWIPRTATRDGGRPRFLSGPAGTSIDDGSAWVLRQEDWRESVDGAAAARAAARLEGQSGAGLSWRASDRGVIAWTAGPDRIPVVLSPTGFDVDQPDDVYLVGESLGTRVGTRLLVRTAPYSMNTLRAAGAASRMASVGGTREGSLSIVVIDPDGKVRSVNESPADGTLDAGRWLRGGFDVRSTSAGVWEITWPASRAGWVGVLDQGRFRHDRVRDVGFVDDTARSDFLLATDGGAVRRTVEGAWGTALAGTAGRVLAGPDGVGVTGAFGAESDLIRQLGPDIASSELVHEDALVRVRRESAGIILEWRDRRSDAWVSHALATLGQSALPWDRLDGMERTGDGTGLLVFSGHVVCRCDLSGRPTTGATPCGLPTTAHSAPVRRGARIAWIEGGESDRAWRVNGDGTADAFASVDEAWGWLTQAVDAGAWRVTGPDPSGLLRMDLRIAAGQYELVRARHGGLNCDVAEGIGAGQRKAVGVTRLGFVAWPAGTDRQHGIFPEMREGSPVGPYASWLTDDGQALLRAPDGRGLRVSAADGTVSVEPAERVPQIASERLASWEAGDLRRGLGGVRFRDRDLQLDLKGDSLVTDGRFSWDHVLGLAGDVVATAVRLERIRADGTLEPADDTESKGRWAGRKQGRGRARVDVGVHAVEVDPSGVRVDGRTLAWPGGPVLDAFPVGDRIWLVRPDGLWFVRAESRWVLRMIEETGSER